MAWVGHQTAFHRGKEQMKILPGLEVTTKAVERTAEAIGEDIVQREQDEIARALQLDLPELMGPPIPVLYVEMDGTGVPRVRKKRPWIDRARISRSSGSCTIIDRSEFTNFSMRPLSSRFWWYIIQRFC